MLYLHAAIEHYIKTSKQLITQHQGKTSYRGQKFSKVHSFKLFIKNL